MPLIIIAGTVSSLPKSNPFPSQGLPNASVVIDADGIEFKVFGFRSEMEAIELLEPGDSVSIQGKLCLVYDQGKLSGLYTIARQVNPLRQRSRNRAALQMVR